MEKQYKLVVYKKKNKINNYLTREEVDYCRFVEDYSHKSYTYNEWIQKLKNNLVYSQTKEEHIAIYEEAIRFFGKVNPDVDLDFLKHCI